jgi:large subunit ribosomal protein L24
MEKFSTHWISSSKAKKQRKFRFNAPNHTRRKLMSANLSKELRKKLARRSIPLRKGDTVRIMRGEFKKQKGKVAEMLKSKIYIEGMQRKKKDGTKVNVPFDTSNVQVLEMVEDKKRVLKQEEKK